MKKLKNLLYFSIAVLMLSPSCKKKEDDETTPGTSQYERGANDETARDEYDASVDEIFKALENTGLSTGRMSSSGVILPCGVVKIDSSGGSYKFVYDSTSNCAKRVLSGSVTASLIAGTQWSDVGAQIQLTYTNYTILFMANGEVLTFNGSLVVTNKDGGKLWEVLNIGGNKVITHLVSGTIMITFNKNKNDTRAWTISKKRIFQSTDGKFSGLTWTLAANGSVAEVGTAKDGSPFTTTIPTPLVWENCSSTGSIEGPFILTMGELVYTAGLNSMTAEPGFTYSLSSKAMTQVNDCSSEGYRLTFNINGSKTVQFQYY